jgi:GWxTD domain-containing protein
MITAFVVVNAQSSHPREPFRITVDISRFRGADDSTLSVEVHYAISQNGLTYKKDSTGWGGGGDVTVLVRGRDTLVYGDRWLVPHAIRDTAEIQAGLNLVGVHALQLTRGDYVLVVIARDRNEPSRTDSVTVRLPIRPLLTDRLVLSDIEFASTIRQGSKQSPFYKNTLEVIPNVGGLYGEDQKAFFYLEAYNLLVGPAAGDYTMRTAVYDAVGKELISKERPKKRSGESAVLVDQVGVDKLKSGTYTLVVSLHDTSSKPLAQSGRKFFVYNPALGIDSTLLTQASSLPLPMYASMDELELDREFKWSRFEISEAERSQFEQLKGAEVKRKFLSDVWRRRPAGARDEYMSRVSFVNSTYSMLAREGYRTDRGRVYIVYGAPDDYERHPNEPDMKPYEIWSYNNIQGGVVFVFLQRNQGGDYELVHSTHRNELHDEDWQRYAVSR